MAAKLSRLQTLNTLTCLSCGNVRTSKYLITAEACPECGRKSLYQKITPIGLNHEKKSIITATHTSIYS